MTARRLVPRIAGGIFFLTSAARFVAAQEPPLEPGARVRVRTGAPHRQTIVGRLVARENQSLVVNVLEPDRLAGTQMDLALERVTGLDVSRGRRAGTVRGALLGAGAGLATGAVAGGIIGSRWADVPDPDWLVGAAYVGGIGLVTGAGLGALIGTMTTVERWQHVPLERLHVSVFPAATSGASPGVSVRFAVTF